MYKQINPLVYRIKIKYVELYGVMPSGPLLNNPEYLIQQITNFKPTSEDKKKQKIDPLLMKLKLKFMEIYGKMPYGLHKDNSDWIIKRISISTSLTDKPQRILLQKEIKKVLNIIQLQYYKIYKIPDKGVGYITLKNNPEWLLNKLADYIPK